MGGKGTLWKSWPSARDLHELVLFNLICRYFPNPAEKLGSEAFMLKPKNGEAQLKNTPFSFIGLPLSSLWEVAELVFIPSCHIIFL